MTQDHGEHYCGSTIVYDPRTEVHSCAGMCSETDLTIDDCTSCVEADPRVERARTALQAGYYPTTSANGAPDLLMDVLADLLHLADVDGVDFDNALILAQRQHRNELIEGPTS